MAAAIGNGSAKPDWLHRSSDGYLVTPCAIQSSGTTGRERQRPGS